MRKGIIFDVDGTLWDACEAIAVSWNEYIRLYAPGVPETATEEMVRSLCGKTMDKFAAAIFPDIEPERAMELTEACCEYEVSYLETHSGRVYPDLEAVLKQLTEAGYPLYIVSNCQTGYVEAFLKQTGYGTYIQDIEYYGRTRRPKDENIRLLCERNQLDKTVYLGDTQGDFEAASAAGSIFVHAAYGFGKVNADVPAVERLRDFPAVAEALLLGD